MRKVQVDESYLVIFYCFLVHAIVDGLHYCFGIIVAELIERRSFSGESVAWVSLILETSWNLFAFIPGGLCRVYGCRIPVMLGGIIVCSGYFAAALTTQDVVSISIFIGLVSGFGMSFLFIPTLIVANTYYKKWRQLANGLVMSGSAIGLAIAEPLAHWLLQHYGIQGSLIYLGGFALQSVVIGALIPPLNTNRNMPEEKQVLLKESKEMDRPDKEREEDNNLRPAAKSDFHSLIHNFLAIDLFPRWTYTFFAVGAFLMDSAINYTVYMFLPHLIIHAGYSSKLSWQPVTCLAIANCVARLLMGLSNKSAFTIMVIFSVSAFVIGLSTICLPLVSKHYLLFCVFATLFGLSKGLHFSVRGPVLAEIVEEIDIDRAIGTATSCSGLSPITTYILLGKLYDMSGTYVWTFLLSGTEATLAGMLLMSVACSLARNKNKSYTGI